MSLLMKDTYRSDLRLQGLTLPLVVLHGTADQTIPVDHGRELADLYSGPKTYLEFAGGTHIDLWDHGAWPRALDALRTMRVFETEKSQ